MLKYAVETVRNRSHHKAIEQRDRAARSCAGEDAAGRQEFEIRERGLECLAPATARARRLGFSRRSGDSRPSGCNVLITGAVLKKAVFGLPDVSGDRRVEGIGILAGCLPLIRPREARRHGRVLCRAGLSVDVYQSLRTCIGCGNGADTLTVRNDRNRLGGQRLAGERVRMPGIASHRRVLRRRDASGPARHRGPERQFAATLVGRQDSKN
jgi:hypothetical protein